MNIVRFSRHAHCSTMSSCENVLNVIASESSHYGDDSDSVLLDSNINYWRCYGNNRPIFRYCYAQKTKENVKDSNGV